jgi:hypothetical protein
MPYPRPCLDRECSHSTSPHDGKHACARVHAWHDRGAPEFVTLPRSTIEICPAPYATPVPVSENHAPMLHSSFSPVHMHELAGPTEPSHAAAGGIESIESGAGSAFVHVPAVRATGRQRRESSSNDARRPSRAANASHRSAARAAAADVVRVNMQSHPSYTSGSPANLGLVLVASHCPYSGSETLSPESRAHHVARRGKRTTRSTPCMIRLWSLDATRDGAICSRRSLDQRFLLLSRGC